MSIKKIETELNDNLVGVYQVFLQKAIELKSKYPKSKKLQDLIFRMKINIDSMSKTASYME